MNISLSASASAWVLGVAVLAVAVAVFAQTTVQQTRDYAQDSLRKAHEKLADLKARWRRPATDTTQAKWRCDAAKRACVAASFGEDSEAQCNEHCNRQGTTEGMLLASNSADGSAVTTECPAGMSKDSDDQLCLRNWDYESASPIIEGLSRETTLGLSRKALQTRARCDGTNLKWLNPPFDAKNLTNIQAIVQPSEHSSCEPGSRRDCVDPSSCAARECGECDPIGLRCEPGKGFKFMGQHTFYDRSLESNRRIALFQCTGKSLSETIPENVTVRLAATSSVHYIGFCTPVHKDVAWPGPGSHKDSKPIEFQYATGTCCFDTDVGINNKEGRTTYSAAKNDSSFDNVDLDKLDKTSDIPTIFTATLESDRRTVSWSNFGLSAEEQRLSEIYPIGVKVEKDPRMAYKDSNNYLTVIGPLWVSVDSNSISGPFKLHDRRCNAQEAGKASGNGPFFLVGDVSLRQGDGETRMVATSWGKDDNGKPPKGIVWKGWDDGRITSNTVKFDDTYHDRQKIEELFRQAARAAKK
jgi:hypothetical protein